MNKKVRWITETAVMLALLVALQALTKGFGQFVTGSCVNAVPAASRDGAITPQTTFTTMRYSTANFPRAAMSHAAIC